MKIEKTVSEKMFCPICKRIFNTSDVYPLPDGVDITECEFCNEILEFKGSE